jgi:hypothetical protein
MASWRISGLEHRQVLDALAGGQGLAEELHHRDAGDLLRVLEGEEHAGLGPHVGGPSGDVVALEADPPSGDLVVGVAEQGVRQGGLARPVRPHEGVQLALVHGEVDAAQDLVPIHGHVEVVDLEQRCSHAAESIPTTRIVEIPATSLHTPQFGLPETPGG